MELISRKEAKENGLKRYFTGKPCRYGHIVERYTADCCCVECKKVKNKSPSAKEYLKKYRQDNRETSVEYSRNYYKENKESILHQQKTYYINNRDKYYAAAAERRALKSSRSYHCFAKEVLQIYKECRQINMKLSSCVEADCVTDVQYHVDHVIPLKSEFVCGLHIPNNLSIIPGSENASKQNKFTPYWENHLTGEVFYGC